MSTVNILKRDMDGTNRNGLLHQMMQKTACTITFYKYHNGIRPCPHTGSPRICLFSSVCGCIQVLRRQRILL